MLFRSEARNALTGNLCRCTGYQQILDAAVSIPLDSCQSVAAHYYSEKQDRELRLALSRALKIESAALKIQAPVSLRAAVSLMGREKKLRLLGSGTDLGVAHNKGKLELSNILSLHLIPELYQIKARSGKLWVGARVTIEELRTCLQDLSSEAARFLDLFASPQIKNIASLVGNIANASPIADTPPFLLACDAILHLHGSKGKRSIPLKDFYLGYKKTALKNGELVAGVELKLPSSREAFGLYKVSERKDLDISSVNAGFLVRRDGEKIQEADRKSTRLNSSH